MKQLDGRVAVVTGGASGIGLALAERFLAEGMRVVLADVEEERLVAAAGGLDAPERVCAVHTDVTVPEQVDALAQQALERFGAVHVVCNNAGVAPGGPMLQAGVDDWRWAVSVNVLGVAYGVRTFGPILAAQGEGHIVNTASEAGLVTNPLLGVYCATKHAVVGLSEALYRELEGTGVGVSVLCPSAVDTDIFHSERNRPHGVDLPAEQHATLAPLRELLRSRGIAPTSVAADVVDAIRADRFWIFTHESTLPAALSRFEDLRTGSNPGPAYGR